jgi:hypothetical protein
VSAGDFADAAYRYSELGWALIRVEGKVPRGKGWQTTTPDEPSYAAGQWANWGGTFGMGVVLGPSGLAVLEYDRDDAREQFLDLLDDAPAPIVRTGSGRRHAYFRASAGVGKAVRDGLELRAGEHQCVLPPSLHPDTGKPYAWERPPWEFPPPDIPSRIVEWFAANRAAEIPTVIEHPHRHETFVQVAASMRAKGANEAAILHALRGLNAEQTGGKPKPDEELVAIARDSGAWKVAEQARAPDGPIFIDLREIEARDVEWIDKPYLPAGELVTNNADGDTGKGLLAVHWAARISRGEFGEDKPRMVLFAVAEDAFDTILKPRLIAAGANFDYIRALSWRRSGTEDALLIPDDIPLLQEHIIAMSVRLLVVDPLLSHVSGKTNTHIDHEVKRALQPLMALAHNTGCTVLGNGHFSKDKSGGARKAASASTAFTNTPRVGLAMAYDDEEPDVRVLEVIKSNLGPKGLGRNYRVKTLLVGGLSEPVPLLVAEGAATKSVDDLLASKKEGKRIPSELVRSLILAELETGEKTRSQIDALVLEKLGANPDTVYKSGISPLHRAGDIKARKDGLNGPWCYRLAVEGWVE